MALGSRLEASEFQPLLLETLQMKTKKKLKKQLKEKYIIKSILKLQNSNLS